MDSSTGNPHGHKKAAHSVLTEDLDDRPGTPTRAALDQVLEFFTRRAADRVSRAARSWRARGRYLTLCGHRIFTVDVPAAGRRVTSAVAHPPWLPDVVVRFPPRRATGWPSTDGCCCSTCSVTGCPTSPTGAYTFALQADIAVAFLEAVGVDHLSLLTHDIGDTVGGELLARQLDGRWAVEIAERTLTNGSIYFALTQFSAGQRFLLGLPDRRLPEDGAPDQAAVMAGVTATFSPGQRRGR